MSEAKFRSFQRLTSLASLLLLTACASGGDYLRPNFSLPLHWLTSSADQETTEPVSAVPEWQDYFADARLQALIEQALQHNTDLRIATARISEARALYGLERADKFPDFEIFGKREAGRTPGDLNLTGQSQTTQRYDVGVELLNYEIDFWGRVARLNEAALASYLATAAAQKTFQLSLIADVADAYYTQCELHERLQLARALADNRIEAAHLADLRRQAGLMGSMEYLQAAAAAEAARRELAALEQARAAADHWLQLLTGWPELNKDRAMAATQLGAPAALPPAPPLMDQQLPALTAGLPSEVLLQRPDIQAAEQRLIAANANVGAARAAFLPRLSLTGALTTASHGLGGLFDSGSRAWIFKPQLRLPLFNAGRDEANVDLAEARQVAAVADYEKTIQQAFREVADLLSARQHLSTQLEAALANQRIQSERVELFEARYKAQISHYLEVLDARRDAELADQSVLQMRQAVLANSARLYKALAGETQFIQRTQPAQAAQPAASTELTLDTQSDATLASTSTAAIE